MVDPIFDYQFRLILIGTDPFSCYLCTGAVILYMSFKIIQYCTLYLKPHAKPRNVAWVTKADVNKIIGKEVVGRVFANTQENGNVFYQATVQLARVHYSDLSQMVS